MYCPCVSCGAVLGAAKPAEASAGEEETYQCTDQGRGQDNYSSRTEQKGKSYVRFAGIQTGSRKPPVLGWYQHRGAGCCHPDRLVSLLHPSSFNGIAFHPNEAIAAPTRSTTIALTSDETRLVVVNREANSVSIIQVKDENGNDVAKKLVEIGVGQEPRCVAVHPNDRRPMSLTASAAPSRSLTSSGQGSKARSRWARSRVAAP